jgi:two-component system, NarL family, response regulator NreC
MIVSKQSVSSPTITKREHEVLNLLAVGSSTKQIAESLQISPHTTETYRKSLLTKFEAKNSAELIKKATKVYWFE